MEPARNQAQISGQYHVTAEHVKPWKATESQVHIALALTNTWSLELPQHPDTAERVSLYSYEIFMVISERQNHACPSML